MAFFTESRLIEYASSDLLNESARRFIATDKSAAKVTIFLSHSHRDSELARGLKNHLASLGISVYIDIDSSDMTTSTSREIAERIKGKIHSLDYFLILATANAMQSRWVPWEIGVADGYKPNKDILVVPVEDNSGKFHGNEYLQLYKRVEIAGDGGTAVFDPNQTRGISAKAWLQGV